MTTATEVTWTAEELRQELARWKRQLLAATNEHGDHYSHHTVTTHTGHAAQFIRWLEDEWKPKGPRRA